MGDRAFLEGRHAIASSSRSRPSRRAAFNDTRIFRQRFEFEDCWRRSSARCGAMPARAASRRRKSWSAARCGSPAAIPTKRSPCSAIGPRSSASGCATTRYVYEPVGAAFFFAQRLRQDAVVLVADFGGGTSDFSVDAVAVAGGMSPRPLGHAGIGIAGDTFDYRIVDQVVSPRLGKAPASLVRQALPVPTGPLHQPRALASARDDEEQRRSARSFGSSRSALKPKLLEDFITIVDLDLGLPLYRAVSDAKVALSARDEVDSASRGRRRHRSTSRRKNLKSWIADDIARLGVTVDKVLGEAGITAREVEKVFLTGGTSFVPAVRKLFADRFGNERLMSGDQSKSIAYGLALIGHSPDPRSMDRKRWDYAEGGRVPSNSRHCLAARNDNGELSSVP